MAKSKYRLGSKSERDRRVILRLSGVCVTLLILLTAFSTLAVGAVSDYANSTKAGEDIGVNAYPAKVGSIYDRNGIVLAESVTGEETKRVFNEEYALSFGTLIGNYSPTAPQNNYGLHKLYKDWLSCGDDISKDEGGSIKLTIDAPLQQSIYNYMTENYPEAEMASAVVIEIDSGKVLAMTDTPSYDPNKGLTEEVLSDERGPLLMKAFQSHIVMGSVFKLPTLVIAANDGYADYVCNDTGVKRVLSGAPTIKNSNKKAYGIITMEEAIKYSSNVYVASVAAGIGAGRLEQQYNKLFWLDEPIYCDFGGVYRARYNLHTEAGFLESSYGEGDMRISPMKMCMITAAIGDNNGDFCQPYAVAAKINADGKVTERGKKKVLTENAVSETAREVIISGMEMAAQRYGIGEINGKTVAAKTGTATVMNGEMNNISMTALYPSENPQYAITLCVCKVPTGTYGKSLSDFMEYIIKQLTDK